MGEGLAPGGGPGSEVSQPDQITRALQLAAGGDRSALDALLPLVYDELRRVAGRHMAEERADHTLQATAVVHEAYFRLVGQRNLDYRDRNQFFAAAANAIRRILVDHARSRGRAKRGGGGGSGRERVTLDGAEVAAAAADAGVAGGVDLIDLDDALGRLAALSERAAKVVELRFFGGLSMGEAAAALGVSPRTAADDWAVARAWLRRELGEGKGV